MNKKKTPAFEFTPTVVTKHIVTHAQRKERRKLIAQDYESMGAVETAKKYGVGLPLVYRAVKEFGVTRGIPGGANGRATSSRTFQIVAMLQNEPERTYQSIAEELGVNSQWIGMVLEKASQAGVKFEGRFRPGVRIKRKVRRFEV